MSLPNIPLLICDGKNDHEIRAQCRGAYMGFVNGPHFFAWQEGLRVDEIRARRMARVLLITKNVVFFLLAGLLVGLVAVQVFLQQEVIQESHYLSLTGAGLLLWIAIASLRREGSNVLPVKKGVTLQNIESGMTWEVARKFHGGAYHNIAYSFDQRAKKVVEDAILLANKRKEHTNEQHLFIRLLDEKELKELCIRFELPPKQLQDTLIQSIATVSSATKENIAESRFYETLAHAYILASQQGEELVRVSHIAESAMMHNEYVAQILEHVGITQTMREHGVAWMRFTRMLSSSYRAYWQKAALHSLSDAGEAMTGLATPLLNSVGKDLIKLAVAGRLLPVVQRETEIEGVMRAFDSGARGVLITGDRGVGKMALIEMIAQKIAGATASKALANKRIIVVPIAFIVSGENPSMYYVRLMQIIGEASRSGNVALVFEDIDGLIGIKAGGGGGQDLSETLAEVIEKTGIMLLGTCSEGAYKTTVARTRLGSLLTRVQLNELDEGGCIQAVESKTAIIENRHGVYVTYQAIAQAVGLSRKLFHDMAAPEKCIRLIEEVCASVAATRGKGQLVRDQDVGFIASQKANVPVQSVNTDERDTLLALEETMKKGVVGQDEAVKAVSSALRRARTNMRSGNRPIASFLFLGPTGVGKTETTKMLARSYFGGEDRMIRFDMSEFQDANAITRLLGETNKQGTGLLTEGIKQKPFAILLLDEFEKADARVLNVFLQLLDDGRITDSVGQTIDCTNVMVIATSNAGSQYIQNAVARGESHENMKTALMQKELQGVYKPELLNRFDGVIVFRPLQREHIEEIAHMLVSSIAEKLKEKEGITLVVTDAEVTSLANRGYSPEFGARPLRRVITDTIETVVADLLLAQKVQRNGTIEIDEGEKVTVR